jgi:ADP-ribosylglycohydrolase
VLLGLAAGDRNGGPIRMAIRVAESLGERRRFDPNDILRRYLAWWRDGAFDTGPTTATVLSLIDGGMDRIRAVERAHEEAGGMTAGCNPAHRVAPLAMAVFLADDELTGSALQEAKLTHHDPLAGDVAAAVVRLFRALIRGVTWDAAVSGAAAGRLDPTIQALDLANPAPLSAGGFAPQVLRAAVHFVGQHGSFADALTASLSFAGPANYSPVLVGAVGSARWGAAAIQPQFLVHCDMLVRAGIAADSLANEWEETA